MNPLAPEVPAHFGPYRTAALLQSQDGWCAIPGCQLPIPLSDTPDAKRRRKGCRYTCQRAFCVALWRSWASLECQRQRRELKARAAIRRRTKSIGATL